MASSSSSSAPATTRRVLDESRVSPPPGSVPPASLPLTSFDLVWLAQPPVNRLFFYRFPHPSDTFITSHLPTLKSSLSLTLKTFYPLAGNLRLSPGSDTQFEVHYADDGDAVPFTVVESDDINFEELSAGHHPRELARIHPLLPQLSAASRPLLAILVTLFPDRGLCIGVTINHAACDGSSSIHFLKSWASTCLSGGLEVASTPPTHDRTLVSTHTSGLYSIYYNQLKEHFMTGSDAIDTPPGAPTPVLASFTLRHDQIQKLKRRVMAGGKAAAHCSTFVVTCAYVWVCLAWAKGYASEKTAYFVFVVNVRARLDPPVPDAYFGNCLGVCCVEASAGELISGEGAGVVAAAVGIGKAIEGLSSGGGGVMRGAEGLVPKMLSLMPHQPISVAGSPKFGVYDTDFGWGRPVLVEVPSIAKGGAISLAEARDGGGGVEIGVALEKQEMDEFEARFHRGL